MCFSKRCGDGATQVVILGAGLDFRCYRLRDELAGAALFEVDHPVTAAVKAERLEAIYGDMPEHVEYVHVDFNTQAVGERLADGGFDPSARSVRPVVGGDDVSSSQRGSPRASGGLPLAPAPAARSASTTCGRRCWTVTTPSSARAELRKRVTSGGEPFKFGIPRGKAAELVEGFGLVLEEDLGPEDAQAQILHHAGEPYGFGGVALVRNPGALTVAFAGVQYLALLRGINVGGNNPVKMSELREALEELGHAEVKTYINSGNVIFRAPRQPRSELAKQLEAKLSRTFGIELKIVLLTGAQVKRVVCRGSSRIRCEDRPMRRDLPALPPYGQAGGRGDGDKGGRRSPFGRAPVPSTSPG